MTKKDYEALAGAIRGIRKEHADYPEVAKIHADGVIASTTEAIANILQADNSRFDRSRFLAACRGEDSHDSAGRRVRYAR